MEEKTTTIINLTLKADKKFFNYNSVIKKTCEKNYNCKIVCSIDTGIQNSVRFWIEGVCLVVVASIGLLGNFLTVMVIANLENSSR